MRNLENAIATMEKYVIKQPDCGLLFANDENNNRETKDNLQSTNKQDPKANQQQDLPSFLIITTNRQSTKTISSELTNAVSSISLQQHASYEKNDPFPLLQSQTC